MSVRVRSALAVAAGLLVAASPDLARAQATGGPVAPVTARKRPASATKTAPPDASTKPSSKQSRPLSRRAKRAEHTGPVATMPGFTMRPDGTSAIFVDLTAPPQVEEHAGKGFVTYVLKDTQVDRANNKNPLETAFYDTPVLRARLRAIPKEDDAELAIELRADVKPTFKVTTEKGNSRLEIVFPAGKFARADFDHELPSAHASRGSRPHAEERSARKGKKGPAAAAPTVPNGDHGRKGPKAP